MKKEGFSFYKFMLSRHGTDALYFFMLAVLILVLVINLFTDSIILTVISIVLLVLTVLRAFSTDKKKRQAENERFLTLSGKVKAPFLYAYNRRKYRKEYTFVRCKKCKGIIAVPSTEEPARVICVRCKTEQAFKREK